MQSPLYLYLYNTSIYIFFFFFEKLSGDGLSTKDWEAQCAAVKILKLHRCEREEFRFPA